MQDLYPILKKILRLAFGLTTSSYPNIYMKVMTNMLRHNGTIYTVKALKTMRLHVTRYICGKPLFVNNSHVGVDSQGWPKALSLLKPLADGDLISKKILLTILSVSRVLEVQKKETLTPNYESITAPGPTKRYVIPRGVIREFVKTYNLRVAKPEFTLADIFLNVKGSPSGKSTLTAGTSILTLGYAQLGWILNLVNAEGAKWISSFYTWAWDSPKVFCKQNCSLYSGQLSFIKDPECKLRIIAMLDYTSQLVLRPIHKILFKLLSRIPMDRTYTQDPHNQWLDDDNSFWSLDLTAATDRFPVVEQTRLIEEIFNDTRFAQSWQNLLTKRDYETPEGKPIQYSVGQPMGAYSSWAAFTLTHHLVVFYCAKLVGKTNFKQYIILGDDIVIKDDAVAKKYQYVMGKLGVELSEAKTHVSKDTYEFAKRWFKGRSEITGLPMRGLNRNRLNPFIVYTILFDYVIVKRNFVIWRGDLVSFVKHFYKGLCLHSKKPKSFNLRVDWSQIERFALGVRLSLGLATYDETRRVFAKALAPNDDMTLPCEREFADLTRRAFSLGIGNMVGKEVGKIMVISNLIVPKMEQFGFDDPNTYKTHPIFVAIHNRIADLAKTIRDLGKMSLAEMADQLTVIDLDNIFSKERRQIIPLYKGGIILTKGLNELKETDEVYYGGSTSDSTWETPFSLSEVHSSTIDMAEKDLKTILDGAYKPAQTQESYESAWGSFWDD